MSISFMQVDASRGRAGQGRSSCQALMLRWILGTLHGVALIGATTAHAQLSISSSGAPTYAQPIAVPPGVAGMSPKLALSYSAGVTNGPVGLGWSVQGISVITRCPAIIAIDGRRSGVSFSADDKLCLDGQRLIRLDDAGNPVAGAGANDAAGVANGTYREYRTEIDSYARIRAYGYANADSTGATGPAFFKIWTKAGQVLEYGASPSADANTKALVMITAPSQTVAMAWTVARMSDSVGNHVDFKYEQRDVNWGSGGTAGAVAGHEWNISEIQYSGAKVVFSYADRADTTPRDKAEAYHQGYKNVSARLLQTITTYINSANTGSLGPSSGAVPVKTIKLAYENGPVSRRSRLKTLQECAGNSSSTRCLPATSFNYAAGGATNYVASTAFNEASVKMIDANGSTGIVVGDFNGDGKTDVLRWSDDPAQNQVYLSNGDGSFSPASNASISGQNIFKSDGCYGSTVVDVNGDGLPDLIRYVAPTSSTGSACVGSSVVFVSNGDGTFTQTPYSGPLLKRDSTATFYFFDVDGDGKVDLVTSLAGTWVWGGISNATYTYKCTNTSGVCTHVYRGNGDGSFTEVSTNIGGQSVYVTPGGVPDLVKPRNLVDVDGSGSLTITIPGSESYRSAWWQAAGGWTFVQPSTAGFVNCASNFIDFNGDGQGDCLYGSVSAASGNALYVGGASPYTSAIVANFDLINAGQELAGSGVGFAVADLNGDGRHDIIRWKDDPSQNAIYLSNGDGSFCPPGTAPLGCPSSAFNFSGIQLKKSDGSADFAIGDFTGKGNSEILRVQTVGGVVANQLYIKQDATPPDQLISVTTGTGATTTLVYVPLSNPYPAAGSGSSNAGARYTGDRLTTNAAALPMIDVTLPMYVVATTITDSGVGASRVNTEYSYLGLKADTRGRGLLGFREVRRQSAGPNGNPLTADTQFLQIQPYIGMAANGAIYNGTLDAIPSATKLSNTASLYCDQAASVGSDTTALGSGVSCPSAAIVQRPYLLLSTQTGQDLVGAPLPTVTTQSSVNATGDPLQTVVTTTGAVAGLSQSFTKTTTNTYQTDDTSCNADNVTCKWIIGRAKTVVVNSSVPNSLPSITTSAGTGQYATATQGTATSPVPLSAATLMSILQLLLDD